MKSGWFTDTLLHESSESRSEKAFPERAPTELMEVHVVELEQQLNGGGGGLKVLDSPSSDSFDGIIRENGLELKLFNLNGSGKN